MKIKNVKTVLSDLMRGCYRFGFTITNYIGERLEASPKSTKFVGGGVDLAAGAGMTYMAVLAAAGTVLSVIAAVSAFPAAPLAAAGALLFGAIRLTLSAMMLGNGLGFLGAAREKAGIPPLFAALKNVKNNMKKKAQDGVAFLKKPFKGDKKISSSFSNAANNNQPAAPTPKKPAPKPGKHFRL